MGVDKPKWQLIFFTFRLCNFSIIDFLVVKMHFINKHHCILEFKQHLSVLINLFFKLFLLIGHFKGVLLVFWYVSWCSQTETHSVAKLKHTKTPSKCCEKLQNILQNTEKLSKML